MTLWKILWRFLLWFLTLFMSIEFRTVLRLLKPYGLQLAMGLVVFFHHPHPARGACTGSSPNWTAQTWADLATCHTNASNGDTITVTAGTYNVTAQTTVTKYVKIIMGGTVTLTDSICTGACTTTYLIDITESTAGSTKLQGPLNINNSGLAGYHSAPAGVVGVEYTSGGKPVLITDVHWDETTGQWGHGDFLAIHGNRGVLWNNSAKGWAGGDATCSNNSSFVRHKWTGGAIANWETPSKWGNTDTNGDQNLYIEDNTLINVNEGIDVDDDGRAVIRHNSITNSGTETHGVDTSGLMGGRYIDYDHNTFIRDTTWPGGNCPAGYTMNMQSFIGIRGGTAIIHDNVIPDINDMAWGDKPEVSFFLEEIRRADGLYPCWMGGYPAPHNTGWGWINGTGNSYTYGDKSGTGTQDIEPIYLWNNTGAGNYASPARVEYTPNVCGAMAPSVVDFVQPGRDYYLSTAKPGYTPYAYPHPLRNETVAAVGVGSRHVRGR